MAKVYQIKVIFFKGSKTSPIDWAIKFLTWGRYSHVGMALPNGEYWESYPGVGVRTFSIEKVTGDYDVYTIEVTREQLRKIHQFLIVQEDKKYDWGGVLRFVFRQPIEQSERNKWFCSELVFSAFLAAGIVLLNNKNYKTSPEVLSYTPLFKQQP